MPPKDSEARPEFYVQTPEGLQPLLPLDEAPDIEAEEWAAEWPNDNPYIKPTTDATLTAEVSISPDVAKAFTALGEACKQAAETLGKVLRAVTDCVVTIARREDIAQLLKATLKEAPPRVRHLALHHKKYRTRKKNINRALRGYKRRSPKSDRPRAYTN